MSYIKLFTTELNNKGLSLYDKAVYGSLITKFQYHNNTEFYTFEKFIADELEVSERTVKRSIKRLVDEGLISINKKYHKQLKQTINYYIINNSILSNENLKPDTSIISSEISEQKPNNNQIEDNIETEDNMNETSTYLPLNFNDYEDKVLTNDEKIAEAIEDNYNVSPDIFFCDINKIQDIKFSVLDDISKLSETNPQIVLDYIKEIRNIA